MEMEGDTSTGQGTLGIMGRCQKLGEGPGADSSSEPPKEPTLTTT